MKKRYVLLSKMVALLIALLLLLVPMVAHTSEGDAWVSSGSGLQGMEPDDPGVELQSGNPPPFEIGAPECEGGELMWGNVATIRICNDGCNVVGSCCDLIDWCQAQCPHCRDGHPGRFQHVYIRGTATGPVTWRIECYGGVHRDEFEISFDPSLGSYGALVIEVHEGVTICRGRKIELEVTREGVTATVFIELIACCFECGPFCLGCDECFHCTVDPCVCTSGLCEKCCPCPGIVKSAYRPIVSPGDYVDYTIKVTRSGLNSEAFRNISVADPLDPLLEFVPSSIRVSGVVYQNGFAYEHNEVTNVLTISNKELYYRAQDGYYEYVVITFTARVRDNAPAGIIPNTAQLDLGYGKRGGNDSAETEVRLEGEPTQVQVTKVWQGDENHLHQRPNYVTVELRRRGQTEPVKTQILNAANNWTHTWSGLLVNEEGGFNWLNYYVIERNVPQGYTSRVVTADNATDGFTATVFNTFIPPHGCNGGAVGGTNGDNRAPLTGDFASTVPLLATILLSVSGLFGGMSLRRKLKK